MTSIARNGIKKTRDEGAGVGGGRRGPRVLGGALRDVFPETRCQRDWVHKTSNVLDSMPKSVHPRAKAAIREITCLERTRRRRASQFEAFSEGFGVKWPKASEKGALLASVRTRADVTKGPDSRDAGLAMIFKLMEAAQRRWRRLNAPHLVALVRAGATFVNGELVERSKEKDAA